MLYDSVMTCPMCRGRIARQAKCPLCGVAIDFRSGQNKTQERQVPMSETENVPPGSRVPKSGKWKCEFCGEGGIAQFFSRHLKGMGREAAASRFEGRTRASTVRFFEAGKTFTECPNCGPSTGWTLVEEPAEKRGEVSAKHGESVSESLACDICRQKVEKPNGYLLTTTQVVGSAGYWEYFFRAYYELHSADLGARGVGSLDDLCGNEAMRTNIAEVASRNASPWLACERCIQLFSVDHKTARRYARKYWNSGRKFSPPGVGPAPLKAVRLGKAILSGALSRQRHPSEAKKWWQFWKRA